MLFPILGICLSKVFRFIEVFEVRFDDLIDEEAIKSKSDWGYRDQLIAITSNFTETQKEILMNLIRVFLVKNQNKTTKSNR